MTHPAPRPAPGSALPVQPDSLLDRLLDARDRLLMNAGFRRWAARSFLTRPIVRGRARALFDLGAGFVYAQVLQACIQLRVMDALAGGARTPAELAPKLALDVEATERLLTAAVPLRLISRRSRGRFALGPLGVALVDNQAVASMIAHHPVLYADLADPVALLRGGPRGTGLAGYWPYARAADPASLGADEVAPYTALMAGSQPAVAEEVLAAYDFRAHRHLLDIGGGNGAFLCAVAVKAPSLRLTLFDLPAVAARGAKRFAEAGLSGRADAVGGSFLSDSLPRGADIASLVRVIHDHDDAAAYAILLAAHAALPRGGTLLIAEPMAETEGAETVGDSYFGMYLLAMGSGRARTAARLCAMLAETGFVRPRLLPAQVPLVTRVIVARRA